MKYPNEHKIGEFMHGITSFRVPFESRILRVNASIWDTWEHVSVSLHTRCPNWREMCFVKDLFWDEEEEVIQLHPKKSQYVNVHEFCLHMWKPPQEIGDFLLTRYGIIGD